MPKIKAYLKNIFQNPMLLGLMTTFLILILVLTNTFKISEYGRNTSLDLLSQLYPYESLYAEYQDDLVFINIDDASLKDWGQWPWPRQLTAKLISKVAEKKPQVIGLDILITEKDRFSPENLSQVLGMSKESIQRAGATNGDLVLGDVIKKTPTVTSFALSNQKIKETQNFSGRFVIIGDSPSFIPEAESLLLPIESLKSSSGSGFVNTYKMEGLVRETPLVAEYHQSLYPSLSLDMIRLAQGVKNHLIKNTDTGQLLIKTGNIPIALSDHGTLILHHGHASRFKTISAGDILKGSPVDLKNKWVIIGSGASGLGDFHSTNLEDDIAGPLFHLQAIDQVLSGRFIQYHIAYDRIIFIVCALLSLLCSYLITRISLHYVLIGLPVVVGLLIGITIYSFVSLGFIFNTPISLLLLLSGSAVTYGAQISYRFIMHRAVEKDIKEATEVQNHLFPKKDAYPFISGGVMPYKSLSGDFIDYVKIENKIAFIEGDVSGKGLPAALLMARSIALFRLFARRKLTADIIARGINDEIYSHGTADKFVTSVIGWYDLEDHKISFVNCGHNPVLLANKIQHQTFDRTSPPLGVIAKDEFLPHLNEVILDEESAMYIATDGITEGLIKISKNKTIELGMMGLVKFAQKNLTLNAADQVDKLLNLIKMQKMIVNDDSTLLVISRPTSKFNEA